MSLNKKMTWSIVLMLLIVGLPSIGPTTLKSQSSEVKAFPGAEGYGTDTTHGRGGRVIAVTNLNDDGPGSLRDAISQEGRRIIVFRVSGTIHLSENIRIKEPFIYIAGQTAPGDGIALRGAGILVNTHDVMIRYLRIRPGDDLSGPAPEQRDGITVGEDGIYNVVIDHNSISWATDENASTWYPISNVTFSWNIFSEGLLDSIHPEGPHSNGLLIGGNSQNVSIHHNLFAHNDYRNPLITGSTRTDIVNNVIYNWGTHAIASIDSRNDNGPIYSNIINNYFKKGPNSEPWEFTIVRGGSEPAESSRFYLYGNIGPNRPNNNTDQWAISRVEPGSYRLNSPHNMAPVTTWDAEYAYNTVLENAGVNYPSRDAVDERIVNDVINGTGHIIDAVSQTPGYPTLGSGQAPPDSDGDGMPDSWETAHGLNPNNANDGPADRNGDGYTNVEEYINSLVDYPTDDPPTTPIKLSADPNNGRPIIVWPNDDRSLWFNFWFIGTEGQGVVSSWHPLDANNVPYGNTVDNKAQCAGMTCTAKSDINLVGGSYALWMRTWGTDGYSIGGNSGYEGWSAITFEVPNTPPGPVTGLTATVENGVVLSWKGAEYATWYNVWVGTDGDATPSWQPYFFSWMLAKDLGCENAGVCTLGTGTSTLFGTASLNLPPGEYIWYVQSWGPGGFSTDGDFDPPSHTWVQADNFLVP